MPPLRSLPTLLALAFGLVALLASCGSLEPVPGDLDGAPGLRYGVVLLAESEVGGAATVDVRGRWTEHSEPAGGLPAAPFGATPDTCLVAEPGAGGAIAGGALAEPADTPLDLDAVLAVRHGRATYARLAGAGDGTYGLLPDHEPLGPLPASGLAIGLDGGDFGRFDGAAFADTEHFAFDAGFDAGRVDRETVFAWRAGDPDDAVAILVGGDADAVFSCVVADDGSFAFDEATRAELAAAGFEEGAIWSAGRLSMVSERRGDDVLTLGVLRLRAFGAAAGE